MHTPSIDAMLGDTNTSSTKSRREQQTSHQDNDPDHPDVSSPHETGAESVPARQRRRDATSDPVRPAAPPTERKERLVNGREVKCPETAGVLRLWDGIQRARAWSRKKAEAKKKKKGETDAVGGQIPTEGKDDYAFVEAETGDDDLGVEALDEEHEGTPTQKKENEDKDGVKDEEGEAWDMIGELYPQTR